MSTKSFVAVAALALAGLVAGCSTANLSPDRIEYQSAPAPRTLEIPPDLTQLPRDDRFTVPDRAGATTSVTASAAAAAASRGQRAAARCWPSPGRANARIEREAPTAGSPSTCRRSRPTTW